MSNVAPINEFNRFEKADIHQGIHEQFEKCAQKYGRRVVIVDPERSFTYEAANNAANNIARNIVKGTGPHGGQVALVLQNDAFTILSLLGALKANKAYVPLDPSFPEERTSFMLQSSEAQLIVTDEANYALARRISSDKVPILTLEEMDLGKPSDNLGLRCDPASLAYILYTSGSTGKPKGIAFGHRNLLHTTMCLINNLHISAEDRLTQLHSTSFAASVVDIYCAILNGASVYPWDVKLRGLRGLATWLNSEGVTSIQWIPTPFRRLLETRGPEDTFDSVRLVVMASEPLTRREFDLYRQHFPSGCLLVNQMGTSESYNYHLFFANKDTVFEGSNVPAGYPVSEDREVLLLDDNRNEVGPGEIGEIVIRSEYMSLGYWNAPELTAKAFCEIPPGGSPKAYLTGDLGRRTEDGCLIPLGRKDWQVKIRGYRIELTEVEYALKKIGGVRDAVAMARSDHQNELKLVAYWIPDTGDSTLSVSQMRKELAGALPDYMIPQIFVRVSEFPMTPSGKIEKNALPPPDADQRPLENVFAEPTTELEDRLQKIWQRVLAVGNVGVTDNFFELGGDSLSAAQVLHLVDTQCHVSLGYSALIQQPTIAGLAKAIEQAKVEQLATLAGGGVESAGKQKGERLFRGVANRLLQIMALYAPGLKSFRVWLHRLRGVAIGTNVAIGTSAIIETAHPELIWIGSNVAIGIRTIIIGHFSDSIDRRETSRKPTVRICDNVYIGPNVTILPNVTIGEGSVVAAGSVVNKSVAPRTMVQGNPARAIARCSVPLVGSGRTYEEFLRHLTPIEGAAS